MDAVSEKLSYIDNERYRVIELFSATQAAR